MCTSISMATASLDLALAVADRFGISEAAARHIASEVGRAVSRWRSEAGRLRIRETEINRMTSAFEHEDLRQALSMA